MIEGKYDPSWMFTYDGERRCSTFIQPGQVSDEDFTPDEFENISEGYRLFAQHQIPGGLKVCLTTEYGRQKYGE